MSEIENVQIKFEALFASLDERLRRLWAATEAIILEKGVIKTVAMATGLSTRTIGQGIKELKKHMTSEEKGGIISSNSERKVRKAGGGRKSLSEKDKKLKI